jgi:hypothetical protein
MELFESLLILSIYLFTNYSIISVLILKLLIKSIYYNKSTVIDTSDPFTIVINILNILFHMIYTIYNMGTMLMMQNKYYSTIFNVYNFFNQKFLFIKNTMVQYLFVIPFNYFIGSKLTSLTSLTSLTTENNNTPIKLKNNKEIGSFLDNLLEEHKK